MTTPDQDVPCLGEKSHDFRDQQLSCRPSHSDAETVLVTIGIVTKLLYEVNQMRNSSLLLRHRWLLSNDITTTLFSHPNLMHPSSVNIDPSSFPKRLSSRRLIPRV